MLQRSQNQSSHHFADQQRLLPVSGSAAAENNPPWPNRNVSSHVSGKATILCIDDHWNGLPKHTTMAATSGRSATSHRHTEWHSNNSSSCSRKRNKQGGYGAARPRGS